MPPTWMQPYKPRTGRSGRGARTKPLERAALMRKVAAVLRANAEELAMLDSINCGNPVREMLNDAKVAAAMIDFCAGLVTEVKGETLPMGDGVLNYSVREPYGVCGRIVAYNHPIMFTAGKIGPPLATGNTVIMKPPYQSPLSAYRMMELIDGILPPGVLSIITAGREGSEALVAHPLVPRLSLIGSVPTGRAIAKAAADRLKHVTLELGGKNACVIYPDADLEKASRGRGGRHELHVVRPIVRVDVAAVRARVRVRACAGGRHGAGQALSTRHADRCRPPRWARSCPRPSSTRS